MSYQEVVEYLDLFINYERTLPLDYMRAFRLERMNRLLGLLDNPHKELRVIHVAGTKGKGSTAALITSILKESGLRAGLYTSPHLTSFRERIRINDELIEEDSLAKIVSGIKPQLEAMRKEDLSFFEAYTAIAFKYFKERDVDFAVIETGLGGRLDATNVAEKSIAVITPISLEHTDILGNTVKKIAREKAAIIKEDSISISAPQKREALDVIEDVCLKKRSTLYLVGRDIYIDKGRFGRDTQSFNVWTKFGEYPSLEIKLRGEHQIINAAAAIGAVETLRAYNLFVSQDAVRKGISKTEWPGRMEVLQRDPLVIADGAQNDESSEALINALKRHFDFKRLILVLGISEDKDIKGICKILSQIADFVILTRADNPRAADPKILKRAIKNRPCKLFLDSRDAMDCAYSEARRDDLILVTGSLFLVGEVRGMTHEIQS
ncbi:MAG: bifunctional folylpolyglutamate synthase/dihydrofolate synthase [Candidatus Omnitrophica bacterium]|nr:bifunctional folylpolyglutamate synthase/dihydrofolate synthase [Candidatus Omnitrophota bacterium]